MSAFQNRILELRINKGITQSELARELAVARSTVNKWELGFREPNFDSLLKIASYFDTTTDYLLGGRDNESGRQD